MAGSKDRQPQVTVSSEREQAMRAQEAYEITSAGRVSVKVGTLLASEAVRDVARLAKQLVELKQKEQKVTKTPSAK